MTTAIETKAAALVERAEHKRQSERDAASSAWRELVKRADAPQQADAERLLKLCDVLGLTLADFRADAQVMRDVSAAEAALIPADRIETMRAEIAEKSAEVARIRDLVLDAVATANAIDLQHSLAVQTNRESRERIAELRKRHPRAFD